MIKIDKEQSNNVEYGDTDTLKDLNESNQVITDTDIITKKQELSKKETTEYICDKLFSKFSFGNVKLFFDLDTSKYTVINYESNDIFEVLKSYDKQSISFMIGSMIHSRIESGQVEPDTMKPKSIKKIKESIRGVKKSFDRDRKEFYIDSDHLPTMNMFKHTYLTSLEITNRITYSKLLEVLDSGKFDKLKILLENNIGNYINIQWFLNWVSIEMNEPKKLKTTFVVIGEQGSGKTLLVEEIFKNIYHSNNVSVLDNKSIKDNFNDIYNYKSFVIMNEVSTMDLKENNQITQDLKRLITDGTFINRGMFKSGLEKVKTFNLGFTTNKNTPLQIEAGDRRFSVFGRGKGLISNTDIKEDFEDFVVGVKQETKEFLPILKSLDYDLTITIKPIMTKLKKDIISTSNTKEDLLKSYFNTKDYNGLETLLMKNGLTDTEFFIKLSKMFKYGIFSNDILFKMYLTIFDLVENDFNGKELTKKSGTFFSKILINPKKSPMKFKGTNVSFKVFEETEIETKKEQLKSVLVGVEEPKRIKEVYTTYEVIKEDMIVSSNQDIKVSNTVKKDKSKPLKDFLGIDIELELDENGEEIMPF